MLKSLCIAFLIILSGCSPSKVHLERECIEYNKGIEFLKKSQPDKALEQFLKIIKSYSFASQSYLEAGKIYLHNYDDPVIAIYYFKQFIFHNKSLPDEKIAQNLIEIAQKRFLQKCIGKNSEINHENKKIFAILKNLRDENMKLKQQLLKYKNSQ